MANLLKTFHFGGTAPIRVHIGEHGAPWFQASDVCAVLDLGNPRQALVRLDEDEKRTVISNDGGPGRNFINESGLYSLVLGSRKPEAKAFKKWITSEVLPAIRKTGAYAVPLQPRQDLFQVAGMEMAVPRTYSEALRAMATISEKAEEQSQKIQALEPKAAFHDAVTSSTDAQSIGQVARALETGQNRLFKWLREEHILMPNNLPFQSYIDSGHFRCIEQTWDDAHGLPHVRLKTLVTGKGMTYIENRWRNGKKVKVIEAVTMAQVADLFDICPEVAENLLTMGWPNGPAKLLPLPDQGDGETRWAKAFVLQLWNELPTEVQQRYREV